MGSQRTRRQKIDIKQFKAEMNFNNQNKQKAETEHSGNSVRALYSQLQEAPVVFRDSKCIQFISFTMWHKPATTLIWSGCLYARNICTITVFTLKLEGNVGFTCQTLPCSAAQTSAAHFLALRDSESIPVGHCHL